MKSMQLIFSEKQIDNTAHQFIKITSEFRHVAFFGSMGAGKTTFITAICKQLGVDDLVSSPTFSIINEYSTRDGIPVFHFDFYRIKKEEELFDIGFEEYCNENDYCFIEWPDKAEDLIPDDFLWVKIEETEKNKRIISFKI